MTPNPTTTSETNTPACSVCGNSDSMIKHSDGKYYCHRTHPRDTSETPRTDARLSGPKNLPMAMDYVPADFARTLERELNEAKADSFDHLSTLISGKESYGNDTHVMITNEHYKHLTSANALIERMATDFKWIKENVKTDQLCSQGNESIWMKADNNITAYKNYKREEGGK